MSDNASAASATAAAFGEASNAGAGDAAEADGHFAAQAEAFAVPGGGPDHRFVENGGDDSAVDDAFKTVVMDFRGELNVDDSGLRIDVEIQV